MPRLFGRDFTIMVIGQIISLFGNAILRFSLSLYVLKLTGSAAAFGGIMALSMVPTIFLSPLGGVLADRVPRQRIMYVLDFSTCALIVLFDFFFAASGNLTAITAIMMLLTVIQALYQPSVQSSIPCLVGEAHLMAANGVVLQVQALANLLGPVLGGFLFPLLGIKAILVASAVCFFLSAVMELFLRIPFTARQRVGSAMAQIKSDLTDALHFLSRDNPKLLRLLVVIGGINLFLSALFIVGLPTLVKLHLNLSDQLYGFAEAALGLGSIVGGLLSGVVAGRVGFRRSYLFILATAVLMGPVVVVLAINAPALVSYGVLVLCVLLGMAFAALFSIAAMTFLQQQTPNELLGKVGAFVTTLSTCALPIGQAMYGGLFQWLHSAPWAVVLFGTAVTLILVVMTKRALSDVKDEGKNNAVTPQGEQ